jgi:flagellar protein FlaI
MTTEDMWRAPHLQEYITTFQRETGMPRPHFHKKLVPTMRRIPKPNLIYPLEGETYAHVFVGKDTKWHYSIVEPQLDEKDEEVYKGLLKIILNLATEIDVAPDDTEAFSEAMKELLTKAIRAGPRVSSEQQKKIEYRMQRDFIQNGKIEPLLHDPNLEDIHTIGTRSIHIVHKIFGMLETNVMFADASELDSYLRLLSERIGKPVSDTNPIIDAALPDGSRINIIYSDDVSKEGPSFTIRKFAEEPLTVTRLVDWGTLSPEMAAYLWMALEYSMNIIISGETASGKTTSLNSLLSFVNHNYKIYTAEDTPEVVIPHDVWQRLVTREAGPEEARVELFDLIKAALRSRPDYIVVGEIRGKEGNVAFQAMQTGHPVISTFHASSISKLIQRFTGDPINVPIRFIDNLNIALFQLLIYERGRITRRVSTLEEILRFSPAKGGVLTRTVFQWDPVEDVHRVRGRVNSHILENLIAPKMGLADVREIYTVLDRRADIISRMVEKRMFGYRQVNAIFRRYYQKGLEGLPDDLR